MSSGIVLVLILYQALTVNSLQCNAPDEAGVSNAELVDVIKAGGRYEEGDVLDYRCNAGFRPIQSSNRVCSDGQWTTLRCIRAFCESLEHPKNGKLLNHDSFVGDEAKFECNEGYILKGSDTLLCRADREWRPKSPPTCAPVRCPPFGHFQDGTMFQESLDGRFNIYGRVVQFTCNSGFYLQGSSKRQCQANRQWSGEESVCKPPTCPDFPPFYNGDIYYTDGEGDHLIYHTVEIECHPGSTLFPEGFDGETHCESQDTWKDTGFTCERKARLGPTANMRLYKLPKSRWNRRQPIYLAREFESRTKFFAECKPKYEMYNEVTKDYSDKTSMNIKADNGTIAPPMQMCKEARCSLRDFWNRDFSYTGNGGIVLGGKVEHDTEVTKTCRGDYEFEPLKDRKSPSYRLTCNKGEIETFPNCIPKRCEIPHGKQAKVGRTRYSSGELVDSGVTVKLTCSSTEELFLDETKEYPDTPFFSQCSFGVWSHPTFPVCTKKRCIVPEHDGTVYQKNGKDIKATIKVNDGTKLIKVCDNGYEILEDKYIVCDSGTWIGDTSCKPKRCRIPYKREANADNKNYTSGDFVQSGIEIKVTCPHTKELYFTETNQYRDNSFSSNCDYGVWSDPTFPVCKNKRCIIPEYNGTKYNNNGTLVIAALKVDDGTKLRKLCDIGYEIADDEDIVCDSGTWKENPSCNPNSCHIPVIQNNRKVADKGVLLHNQQFTVNCKRKFTLVRNGNEVPGGKEQTTCKLGNLTRSIEGLECIPKSCHAGKNAVLYKTEVNGQSEDENSTSFDHDQFASIECKEHYLLVKGNEMLDEKRMTAKCSFGMWNPRYRCRKGTCVLDKQAGLLVDGRRKHGEFKIDSGTTVKLTCTAGYTFYDEANNVTYDDYNISCTGVTLSAQLPTCVNGNQDNLESATPESTTVASTTQQTTFQANDEYEADNTHYAAEDETTPDDGDYDYEEYVYDDVSAEEEVKCKSPENGKHTKQFLKFYKVTCNDGFTLNSNEGDTFYECSDGKLKSRNYGKEPNCTEKSCTLTRNVLWKMEAFSRNRGSKRYYSEDFTFDAGEKLYFDCKDPSMEPTSRKFQCIMGIWTAAERDPNWKMTINNTDPSCRQAVCAQTCEFGGTCIRDGKCACMPGSTGEFCQTPMCQKTCYENGGTCVAPNTCKCDQPRYGINCEKVGCTLADVPKTVVTNKIMASTTFEIGDSFPRDAMSCNDDYSLSTDSNLVCQGNNIWSGIAQCVEGAAYSVILIVGTNQWDGTNYNVTVSLGNQNGDKITVLFKGPMYRGTTHTSTIRAEYIGQIEKSSIEVKVITHIDNIVIDTLHVTVDNANDIEEYIFRNVGTVDRQRYVLPETGCPPPPLTIKSAKQKKRYIAGDQLRDRDVICPEGLSLSPASITCLNTGQWPDSVSCAKDAVYTITILVRLYRWDGTNNNVNVILSNQNRDEIKVLFEGPLFPGSNTTYTKRTKYIGQIEKSSIATTGDDNIYINKMHVIVENDNNVEEYLFNNVGSVIRQRDTWPEAGCAPPPLTIKSQNKKQSYIAGDQLHDSDVLCPEGLILTRASITCLNTGQWSNSVSCAKVTRYRVTLQIGDHYYAGTSDDLYVTFTGSLGQTASKKLVTERKDRNRQYIYDVYANNAGQIQEITIELSGTNDVLLKYVRLDVNNDNTEESYMFSVGDWTKDRNSLRNGISISPDPGCSAPTSQYQLRTQKVKYITDEEIKINEVQCQNGEPQTALKCLKDGRWSGTPCEIEEAGTRNYRIEIKVNLGTKRKVEVELHGKDGISDRETFSYKGLKQGSKTSRSFTLSNIGEVTGIRLALSGDFNDPMKIDYIHLTTKETKEEYLFFYNGQISGQTDINAKELFRPDCAGESFTDGHRGYKTVSVKEVQGDLNSCKEICRIDIECMAIETSDTYCYIIKTNDLHNFVFKDDYYKRTFFFRIC